MPKSSERLPARKEAQAELLAPTRNSRGPSRRTLRFLSHSARLEEVGPPRLLTGMIAIVALFAAGSIGWASITNVTSAAQTGGTVAPEGAIYIVQHLEGGICPGYVRSEW